MAQRYKVINTPSCMAYTPSWAQWIDPGDAGPNVPRTQAQLATWTPVSLGGQWYLMRPLCPCMHMHMPQCKP